MENAADASILHVDMDAFFVAVELRTHPEARGRPVVVARDSARAVVTSASYEARRFGVHSAMPLGQATRLCPNVIVLEPHPERYREASTAVMAIFHEITPLVEQVSIDEAYLDVSGARRLFGSPERIAVGLRDRIHSTTGLTCSVGVATTKSVAKIASGRAKPDGLLVVSADETVAFLHRLPVSALWGVGSVTRDTLQRLGITTIAQLAATPEPVLQRRLGQAQGRLLAELARGIDRREVTPRTPPKSIGHETTFEKDLHDIDELHRELLRLSMKAAARLRAHGCAARTVTLKLRYGDFRTVTRSRSLPEPTTVGRRLFEEVRTVADGLGPPSAGVRLLGVRAENLEPNPPRAALLWDPDAPWRDAESALDEVSARFGAGAVGPASLVGRRRDRVGDTSHPPSEPGSDA